MHFLNLSMAFFIYSYLVGKSCIEVWATRPFIKREYADASIFKCMWLCTALHVEFRGLLYCMEYLEENLEEWLGEQLQVSWGEL
jgi:hypothetical protein